MSKRNRRHFIAFGGLGAVIAVFTFAYFAQPQRSVYSQQTEAGGQAEQAQQIADDCARGLIPSCRFYETEPPARSSDQPNNEEQRLALLDLYAQDRMAHWTAYIGAFTALGVLLLIGTLLETQKTAEAAKAAGDETRRIGQTQLRAYVGPESPKIAVKGDAIRGEVKIKNFGPTPAQSALPIVSLSVRPFPPNGVIRQATMALPGQITPALELWPSATYFARLMLTISNEDHAAIVAGQKAVYMDGQVHYRDVFGEKRETYFSYYKTGRDWLDEKTMALSPIGNSST